MPDAPKQSAPAKAPGQPPDPYRVFNFKLDILGVTEAHFMRFSGIDVRVDPIAYAEGGNTTEYFLPGRTHYDPVTLEAGLTQSHDLWDWMMQLAKGKIPVARKDVHIHLCGLDMTPKVTWTLYAAWPCAWRGAQLNAQVSEYAIQRLELVYERVERQD